MLVCLGLNTLRNKQAVESAFFMENGWIKLHRKALESEVWNDVTAFRVLMWCLLRANHQTGRLTTGREVGAKDCKLKPTTFYKALIRLEKLKIISLVTRKVTIKFTEVTINKWHLYQSSDKLSDNRVTIKGQSSDTIQERRIKKEEITPYNPPLEVLEDIAEKYGVPLAFVKFQLETLRNYIASNGKVYKDPTAALRNFVLRDMKKILEKTKLNGGNYGFTDASKL